MNERWIELEVLRQTPGVKTILALDRKRRTKVIIKWLLHHAHQAWRSQFETEVDILSQLHSQWMPTLIEQGEQGVERYLVEDYFEGQSLESWLAAKPARCHRRQIFRQIVQLIAQVHQIGYLYLDLKSDNILIVKDHACLVDFNACVPIGSLRPVFSNRTALPPECLAGRRMDERADQIGLGQLYLKLCGPGRVAWMALHPDPDRRFFSLAALEKACQPSSFSKGKVFLALGIVVLTFLISLVEQNWPRSNPPPIPLNGTVQGLSAQQIAQGLASGTVESDCLATPAAWAQSVQIACEQKFRPLAGWLYDHPPKEHNPDSQIAQIQLGLFLGVQIDQNQLESVLTSLPGHLGWTGQLALLLDGLCAREVLLKKSCMEELVRALEGEEAISESQSRSILSYLLFFQAEGRQTLPLSQSLIDQLRPGNEQFMSLYLADSL